MTGIKTTIFLVCAAVVLLILPFFASAATARVGALFFLSLTMLTGLHVVTGLTKVISLCHVGFVGVGAYSAAIASLRFGLSPIAGIFVGTLVAACCSLLLACLTVRLEEHYLALGTLAAGEILVNIFRGTSSIAGGANGLSGVPPLRFFHIILDTPSAYYPFCVAIGLGAMVFTWRLDQGGFGRSLRAMGDEGIHLEAIGVSVSRLRVVGLTTGGALAGLAGAVSAYVDGFVGPESYGVGMSIGSLCFLVIGGLGRLEGVLLGAALASLGPELLRGLVEWQMVVVASLSLTVLVYRALQTSRRSHESFSWLSGSEMNGGRPW